MCGEMRSLILALLICSTSAIAETLPVNPDVTQSTIEFTTCQHGWTKTVRPPVSVTSEIKHHLMAKQGLSVFDEPDIILDHKIPLVLGGAPEDVGNLMLQHKAESKDKDRVEVCLARSVCAGRITLQQAQQAIWNNWKSAAALCSGYHAIGSDE